MEKMSETKDKYRKAFFFVLSALIVLIVLFIVFCTLSSQNERKGHLNKIYTDTIVVRDTIHIEVPVEKIKYRDRRVVDTLYVPTSQDTTTPLPIEQKVYQDSISDIWISGYQPNIDSINYHIPKQTIYVDKVVEVPQVKKWYEDRFIISAGVYGGYGLIHKQADVFVGLGVGIRLY